MFDDLRERATAEYEEIEPEPTSPLAGLSRFVDGLTAQQRFVIAVILLLNVSVIGCRCLFAFERIQF